MPAAYDIDLRERIVKTRLEKKMKIVEIARLFDISRNTTGSRLKRYRTTGNVEPFVAKREGCELKAEDPERFRKSVAGEPGITHARIAEKYGGISPATAGRTLKRPGYTRKKSFIFRERDEKKRKIFVTRISRIPPEKRVYVDESGFDNASRVNSGYSPKVSRCTERVRSRASERMTAIAGQRPGKTLALCCSGTIRIPLLLRPGLGMRLFPSRLRVTR